VNVNSFQVASTSILRRIHNSCSILREASPQIILHNKAKSWHGGSTWSHQILREQIAQGSLASIEKTNWIAKMLLELRHLEKAAVRFSKRMSADQEAKRS
jgi:hypothetical protein